MLPFGGTVRPSKMYLKSVGGVGFDSVATPEDGLNVSEVRLEYAAGEPDGHRLSIQINAKATSVELYDWQLIPIARFSDSENPSCFTLFGELEDSAEQDGLMQKGARIMNYAAPFDNTLLGLRLMQLDLLLLGETSFATDLPKENGRYILGGGESEPTLEGNRAAKLKYDAAFQRLTREIGEVKARFSTYVICDVDQKVVFSVVDNRLKLTGEPFYYFASTNHLELVEAEVKKRVDAGDTNLTKAMLRVQLGVSTKADDRLIKEILAQMEPTSVYEFKSELSKRHSDLVPQIEKMNPHVWQAARATMRFAAFFRYCKTKNPDNWREFIASVRSVRLIPEVETPTVMTFSK